MTMNPRERELGGKKEEEGEYTKFPKMTSSSPPSPRQWSSTLKNPRIVRVAPGFGGKDRHSKVCTVKGLRDRRIRLSVPTAIQLYDLQERLGLSQPSKVIDWLIDATKLDIDKLPPLPTIPTNFLQFHQPPSVLPNHHDHHPYASEFLYPNLFRERERWSDDQEGFGGFVAQNFFPLNSTQFANPNYFQLEPPDLSLSQFGGLGFGFSNRPHHEDNSNCSLSSSSQASSSQIYMSPSAAHFQPYFAANSVENDQFRDLQLQNSSMRSFSMNASLHSRENDKENET